MRAAHWVATVALAAWLIGFAWVQPGLAADEPLTAAERAKLQKQAVELAQRALVLSGEGKPTAALPLTRRCLEICERLYPVTDFPDGHPDLAISLNNLGSLLQAMGEYSKALPYFEKALAMRHRLYPVERFKNGHPELHSLSSLGTLLKAMGEYSKALPHFEKALAMRHRLYSVEHFKDGHPHLAQSLNNLGSLLKAMGEYSKALPYYEQALAMRQGLYPVERFTNGHPDLAISLSSLGSLLQAMGEYSKALPYFEKALAMRHRLYPVERFKNGHPDLAISLSSLGTLLKAMGEYSKALPHFEKVLAMRQRLYSVEHFKDGHPHLGQSLNNLGYLLKAMGEYSKALPYFEKALAMKQRLYPAERFKDGHPELAISLNNLGSLLEAMGEYSKALPYFEKALAMNQRLYPAERFKDGHPELARSLNNLGLLFHARGEYGKAESYLREALITHQRLATSFASQAAEATSLNFLARLPKSRDFFLSTTAHLPEAAPAAAYAVLWQGKAVLSRTLERRQRLLHALTDDESRGKLLELLAVRRDLARLILGADREDKNREERLKGLTERKERLERELAAKLPELKEAQSPHTDLSEHLPDDAAFVDLFRYLHRPKGEKNWRPHYVAFVLRKGAKVVRVELDRAEPIEKALTAWRKDIDKELDSKAAAELRALIWEKLAKHLPDKPGSVVYLCPDGDLSALPWAALPGREKGTILLEDHALALVPHGPALLEHLRHKDKDRPATGALLALGGPQYEKAPEAARRPQELAEVRPAARADKDGVWPELPGTARESAAIVALARGLPKPPKLLERTGSSASATQLYLDLPQVRWAHLATHGFFAAPATKERKYLFDEKEFRLGVQGFSGRERLGTGARHPLTQTGLVLAGANRKGKDAPADGGILTAEAIAGLDLRHLELAVLSACETGLGEGLNGEGVFGLQRAFHLGGCRNVIASLWKVDDDATAALMAVFYHELWVNERPPLEALRRAQLALYRHPADVKTLARGRGPDFDKTVKRVTQTPPKGERPKKVATVKDWAAFVLSGPG